MKPNRIWTAAAVLLTTVGIDGTVHAQDQGYAAPKWELALYGGGAYSGGLV